MEKNTAHKIWELQEAMKQLPEFSALSSEYQLQNDRLLDILETMTASQKEAVFGYIGALIEIHLKTLDLALR